MNLPGLADAWLLAFMLAAFFAALVLVPASLVGIRIRVREALELVCWLTLAVILIAQLKAFV